MAGDGLEDLAGRQGLRRGAVRRGTERPVARWPGGAAGRRSRRETPARPRRRDRGGRGPPASRTPRRRGARGQQPALEEDRRSSRLRVVGQDQVSDRDETRRRRAIPADGAERFGRDANLLVQQSLQAKVDWPGGTLGQRYVQARFHHPLSRVPAARTNSPTPVSLHPWASLSTARSIPSNATVERRVTPSWPTESGFEEEERPGFALGIPASLGRAYRSAAVAGRPPALFKPASAAL